MLRVAEQAQRTDTGRQRNANEDSFFARAPVFAVADGMGGARAGEVASRLAAEVFDAGNVGEEAPEIYLGRVANEANQRIHEVAESDSSRSGMGTTLTAAMVQGDEVSLAHVGDSRAYLFRDRKLRRLTEDHSLVEELQRQGRLTEEQASEHPQRSIITRALGPESTVEVDTMTYKATDGDVFLLCSDGLTTMVPDEEIATALAAEAELGRLVHRLVKKANEAGGRDNITVLAFRLEQVSAPVAEPGVTTVVPAVSVDEAPPAPAPAVASTAARRAPDRPVEAQPPARRPVVTTRRALRVLVPVAVVAAVVAGAWLGARQIYFLGTDEGGRVALFRGVPYELPFGITLYDERYSSPVQAESLPADRQESVRDHNLRSRSDAVSLIEDLQAAAIEAARSPASSAGEAGEVE
jgi:serine/threonine protein phosphatase PrpC